ncbi:FAD-dependent oxidoreductase [Intrasporangium sp. YIM S08009]|uniref:FAD-dependent oxidoreductase n=1 Tax=Intrasporangium zincisolvens TaxID=3080018 RepID=UPI002B05BAE8|nr:FAD-dependent oxidoreductase [Intrasporangium sp. YIM S08009]
MSSTLSPTLSPAPSPCSPDAPRRHVLVVGNGMAGARFAEELRRRDAEVAITVVGEEPHEAYNRVLLSTVVAGTIGPRETRLKPNGWWATHDVLVRAGIRVTALDVSARTATLTAAAPDAGGVAAPEVLRWDELVLATGSDAFVPPIAGAADDPSVIAFRTLDDAERLVTAAESAHHAVVVGGGLLGLEAARGLLGHGVHVTVVHPAAHPMDRQLDHDGGAVLTRVVQGLGARLALGRQVGERRRATSEAPGAVVLDDGTELPADLVVLAAGVRPRVDLARAAGLDVGRGVVVDDRLGASHPHVHAIGECAEHRGEVPGLVQPGWDQARVLADVLSGADPAATYTGTSVVTRLKAPDVDLTSMGRVDVGVHDAGHEVLAFTDPVRGRYAKLVLRADRLVGAILLGVGDAAGPLTQLYDTGATAPRDRLALMLGRAVTRAGGAESVNLAEMPGGAVICRCNTVTKSAIVEAFRSGADTVPAVAEATRATTGCGSCASAVDGLCSWLRSAEPSVSPNTTLGRPEGQSEPLEEGAA